MRIHRTTSRPTLVAKEQVVIDTPQQVRFSWRGFALVMGFSLIIRAGVFWALYDNLAEDRDMYRAITHTLVTEKVFGKTVGNRQTDIDTYWSRHPHNISTVSTAYRPPLYPILLSFLGGSGSQNGVASNSVYCFHLVLGLLTVALSILLGWRLGIGNWSLAAGALVACDPTLLFWSTFVMTETLATFLCVVLLITLHRLSDRPTLINAAFSGAAAGFAMLCRPTFLAFLLLTVMTIVVMKTDWRKRVVTLIAFVVTLCAVLAPWTIRNYRLFQRPIYATTHGGYTLLLGNNEFFYEYVRNGQWGLAWDANEFHAYSESELARTTNPIDEVLNDDQAYSLAFQAIRRDPIGFVLSCFVRVGQLWTPLPYRLQPQTSLANDLLRYLIALWYAVVYVLAISGLVAIGKKSLQTPWLWGLLLCFSFTAVHTFYWSNIRMRAPLMPFVCIVAAVGAQQIAAWYRRRKR